MNRNWNLSGLILEGTCGSGKTSIFQALLRSNRFVRRTFPSVVVLSEHQTQRVLEQKEREEGLKREDNISLLEGHVSYLERLRDRLERVQTLYLQRGSGLLFFSFLPVLGLLLSSGAGIDGIQVSKFVLWVLMGRMLRNSILWVLVAQGLYVVGV